MELVAVRNELIAEKLKTSEMRRTLNIINMQVTSFFSQYIKSIEQCVARTDIDISVPQNEAETPGTSTSQSALIFRPNAIQRAIDPEIPNVLHTIMEESLVEDSFDRRASIPTSTPFARETMIREEDEEASTPRMSHLAHSMVLPSPSPVRFVTSRTKRDYTFSTHASMPSPSQSSTLVSPTSNDNSSQHPETDDMSSEGEATETTTEEISKQPNPRRQNISVGLDSSEDEETVNAANDEETLNVAKESFKSPESMFNMSVSKIPLKEALINVTKLDTTPKTVNRYLNAFSKERNETEENENDPSGTIEPSDQENMIADQENTMADESTALATSTISLPTSSKSSTVLKRKSSTDVARRSTGRPKRKAKLCVSLAEKPLKSKLRRS